MPNVIDSARPLLIELLKREEGLELVPYKCSAGIWTIGVGCTRYPDGRPVKGDDPPISEDKAMRMLSIECVRYLLNVAEMCTRPTSPPELAAMTSLAYNVGTGAFGRSSVLRLHNAGDQTGAARAFHLWNKARVNGVLTELRGLTARRAREAALYLTPDAGRAPEPMSQAVEPESLMVASPIAQGGSVVATIGVAGVATAPPMADVLPLLGQAREEAAKVADWLGVSPWLVVAGVLLAAGLWVVRWRLKQRAAGWA